MPEWGISAPWWAVVALTFTLFLAVVKAARWTARTDGRFNRLEQCLEEIRADIKQIFNRLPAPTQQMNSSISLDECCAKDSATGRSDDQETV